MDCVTILIQHNGEWENNSKYINYIVDAVVVNFDCDFEDLTTIISTQIGVDSTLYCTDIRYVLTDQIPAILIHNNMSVRVYMELKRKNADLSSYPLCVTLKGIFMEDFNNITTLATISIENRGNIQEVYNVETIEMLEAGSRDCGKIVNENVNHIIDDYFHLEVEKQQIYKDKTTIVKVMKNYSIRNQFRVRVRRSSSTRYDLGCIDENCSWSFKSTSLSKSHLFKVRSFNKLHSCNALDLYMTQSQANSTIIASLVMDKMDDPKTVYRPNDIINDIQKNYSVELTYMQAWRSREKAIELIRGKPAGSYCKLPMYLYMITHTNPGSVTRLHKSEDERFLYCYVALYASIKGWEYCRPVMVVDGSFLKATYKGTILIASTQDADGHILPLAYAIVDSENDASWEWFFQQIKDTYGVREGMCIVSDRHDSIKNATSIVYPTVPHCVCIYHLWNNIKKNFKKSQAKIKEIFFAMANSYTTRQFDHLMAEVNKIDSRVSRYLMEIGYDRWSRVHARVNRGMFMTSNIAESLNSSNKEARDLPVLGLLDFMTTLIQKWNCSNKKIAINTTTKLSNKYNRILLESMHASVRMRVMPANEYLYTVIDKVKQYIVCLKASTCTCKKYQIDELPCLYVCAVLRKNYVHGEEYCSLYYTKESMLKTYEVSVQPLPNESTWDIPKEILEEIVLPPKGKRGPGRPRKKRVKGITEIKKKRAKTSCGSCGQQGHNRRSCKNIPE